MRKNFKKILATVSAVAMCATSVVSMGAGAIAVFKDREVRPETTSFYANIYGDNIKFNLWQEATDYYDDEDTKFYISDIRVNSLGEEYTYTLISSHVKYDTRDYCSVGLVGFYGYHLTDENDISDLEKYLSDNKIQYEKEEYSDVTYIYIRQPYETDYEYLEILQKIKEDTGFIAGWISPATMVQVTETENTLPAPTLLGDANEDGEVSLADAVLIMQSISNPDVFQLTPQGMANADIYGDGDGITVIDALRIQEICIDL
ncbi:MAG: hypothetical protein HDT23_05305 [Ruminococcus sp.]|nr:hypothetical protein [Ruminococcus sp.]